MYIYIYIYMYIYRERERARGREGSSEYGTYKTVQAGLWPSRYAPTRHKFRVVDGGRNQDVGECDESGLGRVYRGTSLLRNCPSQGPCGRPMPRLLWWS